jgi:DNA polymerase-3 subunit delta'
MIGSGSFAMRLVDCVGHRQALALLTRAASRAALPHSLLFAGPSGVGKFTVAAALAQTLNSEAPVEGDGPIHVDACGRCRSCQRFARVLEQMRAGAEVALDCFIRLVPDDKGSIKVGVVREMLARTAFKPFDGRRRLAVVDQADALEVASQNALLKALEEPPAATVFVLVTSRPDSLLETVRSRCPRVRFGPLSPDMVTEVLVRDHGMERARAVAVAAVSGGSVGEALAREAGAFAADRDAAIDVLDALVAAGAPAARLQAMQGLMRRTGGGGRGGKKGEATLSRQAFATRLDALKGVVRDACATAVQADPRGIGNADVADRLARLAAAVETPRLVRAFTAIDRAQNALDRNAQPKVVADWLALQL